MKNTFLGLEKSQGQIAEILEKSRIFLRGKKWEPCLMLLHVK